MEEINLFDYEYPANHMTEIPSNNLLNIMYFCKKVLESQPTMGVTYAYPDNVKITKNKEGGLTKVDWDWIPYKQEDISAFFASMENVVPMATEVSVLSEQVHYAYANIHKQNIEKGIAKKRADLTNELENEEVEQLLNKKK